MISSLVFSGALSFSVRLEVAALTGAVIFPHRQGDYSSEQGDSKENAGKRQPERSKTVAARRRRNSDKAATRQR
jgi:hypothetical protein